MGRSDEAWFEGIVDAARPVLDDGLGVAGLEVDFSDMRAPRVQVLAEAGTKQGWIPEFLSGLVGRLSPSYVDAVRRSNRIIASAISGWGDEPFVRDGFIHSWDVRDLVNLDGLEADGTGCAICGFARGVAHLTRNQQDIISRTARHVAAGYQLRKRLRIVSRTLDLPVNAEAVLDPSGRVQHAEGLAQSREARATLREAAIGITHARSLRHDDTGTPLDHWTPRVLARWTLVDRFEHDGKRYLLACENEPAAPGPLMLTERERQVAGLAALGHTSKLIAYELGVSYSTVRVLLSRAARKLRVSSREELIGAVNAWSRSKDDAT